MLEIYWSFDLRSSLFSPQSVRHRVWRSGSLVGGDELAREFRKLVVDRFAGILSGACSLLRRHRESGVWM